MIIVAASALTVASCGPSRETGVFFPSAAEPDLPPVAAAPDFRTQEDAYRIRSGDQLDVKFPYRPEFNETLTVRPDGRIALPLIGVVEVAGRSPDELSAMLKENYAALQRGLAPPSQREYIITAGDVLEIKSAVDPSLNEQVTVRPDGRISLPVAGTLVAEGSTPETLEQEIRRRLRGQTANANVTLIVRTMQSRQFRADGRTIKAPILDLDEVYVVLRSFPAPRYFVAGEVLRPAEQPYTGPISILQAVFAAGGPTPGGEMRSVVILRKGEANKPVVIVRDLQSDIAGKTQNDLQLKPFDIVYVPKTRIAEVQDFLDQYIYRLIPALRNSSVGFSFIYELGRRNQ
jgi:polysaccharide export outer membrane protein